MEAIFRMKMVAGILLLVIYAGFVGLNLHGSLDTLLEAGRTAAEDKADIAAWPKAMENVANELIYEKQSMINAFSFIQVVLDKNEENNFEVVKDVEGHGHFTWFQGVPWVDPLVFQRVKALKAHLPSTTRLMAILPPDKQLKDTVFARGLPNNHINDLADIYRSELGKMGVDVFDVRERIDFTSLKREDIFYKADHHWTVETTFWAFAELATFLRDSHGISVDPFYLDRNNYNAVTYKEMFVGSMVKKTGLPFLEADDLTLIYPKFATDYVFSIDGVDGSQDNIKIRGRFERVFYYPDTSKKYVFVNYGSILWDMQPTKHIQNLDNPKGQKMLIIQDSFGWPVTSFLSTLCSDIWLIDPRLYQDSYADFIRKNNPDYVFILFGLSELNPDLFTAAMEK
jgi:hypothetical protein